MTSVSLELKNLLAALLFAVAFFTGVLVNGGQLKAQSVQWQQANPFPGVEWLQYDGPVEGLRQWINVLRIDQRRFKIAFAHQKDVLKPLSDWADSAGALAAVNGNFFHPIEGGSVCYTKVDGLVSDTTRYDLPARWFLGPLDDAALVYADSVWRIIAQPSGGWPGVPFPTVVSSGPPLLINHQPLSFDNHSFNTKRYGRSAVGVTETGLMIWFTVSGKEPGSSGFTMVELQKAMQDLGCSDAMNLDGGSSTALWIKDKGIQGIVSNPQGKPSPAKKIANALVIVPVN